MAGSLLPVLALCMAALWVAALPVLALQPETNSVV